ncbi:MAG: TonB-dependent receptor [Verrucomicrobia bacterium]|nr:TonB-dependent receptor [Verrucomicrobiota bacterium]
MRSLVALLTLSAIFLLPTPAAAKPEDPGTSAHAPNPSTTANTTASGAVQGRLLGPDGAPASGVKVVLPDVQLVTETDDRGVFLFPAVPSGTHQLVAVGSGYRSLRMSGLLVAASRTLTVETQTLQAAEEVTQLDPFVVEGQRRRLGAVARGEALLIPRMAGGNLDLPRTQDGALPYRIYNREQLERSGVVNLNAFLQRELLDSDAATRPPEQSGLLDAFTTGSSNLNLRGFGTDATVILLNGRRLPESPPPPGSSELAAADLNFIPLSLVQQIEVLPVSASALYSGNAIGGVINIVLRPDLDTTELSTTYTNALQGFSAPQSSLSLQHGRTLLNGKLRLRLNANFARSTPPTKSDLGYLRTASTSTAPTNSPLYGATPNIRNADGTPLFSANSATVTSVAPGADGSGGLAAFAGRENVRNSALFAPDAGLVALPGSLHYPFGRRERRAAALTSVTYDVLPNLQLGLDAIHSHSVISRGYDAFTADLKLSASAPSNPFGRDVVVSLNEMAPALGENYSEASIRFNSLVLAALVRLPAEWRLVFDGQFTRNITHFRGLAGVDRDRWQALVDRGLYNPLRDTQVVAPPAAFYDEVLLYRGGRNRSVVLSDYQTYDGAIRLTNQALTLPTGLGTLALGTDYRNNHLSSHTDTSVYADGTPAEDPVFWSGRGITRYSLFGELQAPLLPAHWMPNGIRGIDTDFGARYVASSSGAEANLAPAGGIKISFAHGFALRGSVATANRFPTPVMGSRNTLGDDPTPGAGPIEYPTILDSRRQESYTIASRDAPNRGLRAESAVTRTVGVVYDIGQIHRLRASLDYVMTKKAMELIYLSAQTAADLESLWPARVIRAPLEIGDTHEVGKITNITTGVVNVAWRRSENLNLTLDYVWTECFNGTLEVYGRWIGYQRYERQVLPKSPVVDELSEPDGTAGGLLGQRVGFGADWSNNQVGFGLDGHYYGSRSLPLSERTAQGGANVSPFWQYDAYVQCELRRWIPWFDEKNGLRVQVRIDNIFDTSFPYYANDPSGAGVQCYGDWRGRTYSLSLTATF